MTVSIVMFLVIAGIIAYAIVSDLSKRKNKNRPPENFQEDDGENKSTIRKKDFSGFNPYIGS